MVCLTFPFSDAAIIITDNDVATETGKINIELER